MLKAANNAETRLKESVSKDDDEIAVEDAGLFPDTPFLVTLGDDEIMKVTDVDDDTLTVDRGQEDTEAKDYDEGEIVTNRFTAGMYDAIFEELDDHKGNNLPHQFTSDDKTYNYGFKLNEDKDGLIFVYEED